jgi:hypothetical protein
MGRVIERRLYEEIARLCAEGRRKALRGETPEALATYLEAWELLPDPKDAGDAAACVLSGLAQVLTARGDLSAATTVMHAARRAAGSAPLRDAGV